MHDYEECPVYKRAKHVKETLEAMQDASNVHHVSNKLTWVVPLMSMCPEICRPGACHNPELLKAVRVTDAWIIGYWLKYWGPG